MGVKERRREKEEKKEKSEIEEKEQTTEFEREIELEKHSPEIVIEHPVKTETAKAQTEDIEIQTRTDDSIITSTQEQLIPTWGTPEQSEWMYHIPPREEDKDLWAEEWSDYVLKWAEKNEAHILSITTFIKEFPFSEMSNKVDAFRLIADTLIEKEIAEWLDKNERQLRVYWRFLEEWADLIYEWALANGKLRLDVKSMVIQEQEEKFAKLPERDLYIVMSIMVDKGYAKFVDKTSGAIIVKTKT